jgi:hypothetical protein
VVRLRLGDVRPQGLERSRRIYLFADRDAGDTIEFDYVLTSTGIDDVQEGKLVLQVAPEVTLLEDIVPHDERTHD